MSKVINILLITTLLILIFPSSTLALGETNCNSNLIVAGSLVKPDTIYTHQNFDIKVTFNKSWINPNAQYRIHVTDTGTPEKDQADSTAISLPDSASSTNTDITFTVDGSSIDTAVSKLHINLDEIGNCTLANLGNIEVFDNDFAQVKGCSLKMPSNIKQGDKFSVTTNTPTVTGIDYTLYFWKTSDVHPSLPTSRIVDRNTLGNLLTGAVVFNFGALPTPSHGFSYNNDGSSGGIDRLGRGIFYTSLPKENYIGAIAAQKTGTSQIIFCTANSFTVNNEDTAPPIPSEPIAPPGPGTAGKSVDYGPKATAGGLFCDDTHTTLKTVIGCVPVEPSALISGILKFATGIGGGIAFLLMLMGSFQMVTSAGNPEALKAGQDRFSSAIVGLLFIIFAILILKIIGVDILGLGRFFG